jgi:hypothetical protein
MTYTTKQYQVEAMKTKSGVYRPENFNGETWMDMRVGAEHLGLQAKLLKKSVFSAKKVSVRRSQPVPIHCNPDLIHAILGVWNEGGEIAEVVAGVRLNIPEALAAADLEMADLLWFIALWCEGRGFDLGTLMRMNIAKLRARHGEKFDSEKMDDAKRDPDAENRAAEEARNTQ